MIRVLERERKWLASVVGAGEVTQDMLDHKANLVAGCVTILMGSPDAGRYGQWVKRKPKRVALIKDATAFITKAGHKAVMNLLDLVVSDLLACKPFRKVVYCGPLAVRARQKRQVTDKVRKHLARAREAKAEARRRAGMVRADRTRQHLQIHRPEADGNAA